MYKFISGLVVGVVLTLAVIVFLAPQALLDDGDVQFDQPAAADGDGAPSPSQAPALSTQQRQLDDALSAPPPAPQDDDAGAVGRSPGDAPTSATGRDAGPAPAERGGLSDTTGSPPPNDAAAATPDPTLSPQHRALLESARANDDVETLPQVHDRFAAESVDAGWAYTMQQMLTQYLTDAAVASGFDIVQLECRSTLCRVQTIGYSDGAVEQWGEIAAGIRQQPWGAEFGHTWSQSSMQDGRAILLTLLERRSSPADTTP